MAKWAGNHRGKMDKGIYISTGAGSVIAALIFVAMLGTASAAEEPVQYKNFVHFGAPVTGIDFFASRRKEVAPYEKPLTEARERLGLLLGEDLPKGAIFICSTPEQKDAIYEPKVLRMGFDWTLTLITAEARAQETLERIKSQMGGEVPAEIMDRIKNRSAGMNAAAESRMITTLAREVAYAIIQTKFNENLQYRSSRISDMGKSPLPDWLDIGIASYAVGEDLNASYLQQHLEESVPIEDILTMARPFVASSFIQSGGGSGGMTGRSGGSQGGSPGGFGGGQDGPPSGFGGGQGGPPQGFSGGQRGGFQRTIPKDEQDQMLFDGQSSTFFRYLTEKIGIEKVGELIRKAKDGMESVDFLAQPEVLGSDFEQIEKDWIGWVATRNAEQKPQTSEQKRPVN